MNDNELAEDIAGRMGIDQDAYMQICTEALAYSEVAE